MWGGPRGRFHVKSSDDSTWESSGTAANVDPPGRQGAKDIQDVLPSEGGTKAVSSSRVPGDVRDTDGDAGALRAPSRTQHKRA